MSKKTDTNKPFAFQFRALTFKVLDLTGELEEVGKELSPADLARGYETPDFREVAREILDMLDTAESRIVASREHWRSVRDRC